MVRGRVEVLRRAAVTIGGNPLFGNKSDTSPGYFEQRIEIFSPPYLFHGPRPELTGGPQQLAPGATAVFSTPDASKIVTARLMRPSAVTHVTDLEQRSIALGLRRMHSAVAVQHIPGVVPVARHQRHVSGDVPTAPVGADRYVRRRRRRSGCRFQARTRQKSPLVSPATTGFARRCGRA